MKVVSCRDSAALVQVVADRFVTVVTTAYDSGQRADIVLTGGRIASELYVELGHRLEPRPELVSVIHWWWGDERYIPADHHDRNAWQARHLLLQPLGVVERQIHEAPAADSQLTLTQAAEAYGFALADVSGPFTLTLLGLGEDGHVASLFPGEPNQPGTVVAVPNSPKPPPARLSMTATRLARSDEVWLLASGPAKREAVHQLLAGVPLPASWVDGAQTTLFTDQA